LIAKGMDLRQLRYFVAVVECRSMRKAAERLCIVQPAISVQIAKLEAGLGGPVLERTAKGMHPTRAGSELYGRAILLLSQLEEMQAAVSELVKLDTAIGSATLGDSRTG
jgi:LysR family nitrogen assimilation transcriptional regulator